MNENTARLLEQLAAKIGTTSQHLWGVLIKQAPIDATTTLFQILLIIVGVVVCFNKHKKYISKVEIYEVNYYEKSETTAIIMAVFGVVLLVLCIVAFFNVPYIIDGYFNPEYWALREIMKAIHY